MPPQVGQKPTCLGLKRNIRAQLDLARAVEIAQARGSKATVRYSVAGVRPIGVVEEVQELRLERELVSFAERNGFGNRYIVIPQVWPIEPRIESKSSWVGVVAHAGKERV